MQRIAVVDLGTGNLHSVAKALEKVAPQARVTVSADPVQLHDASHVVLPGQGAIGSWLGALNDSGLRDVIAQAMVCRPLLGICVGMQALFDHSDEDGGVQGLGVVPGVVHRFRHSRDDPKTRLKVPHMGWNNVTQCGSHPLWQGIDQHARFYFVHSYYADAANQADVAGVTEYGVRFACAVAHENIFAVQFHPEKSHRQGLQLLENFVSWDGLSKR